MDIINLTISEAARKKLLQDLASNMDLDPIVSVYWSERGEVYKENNGGKELIRKLPDQWGVGFNEIAKIPVEFHQVIDGITFYFDQGEISKRLNGKILDVSEGCYVVVDA